MPAVPEPETPETPEPFLLPMPPEFPHPENLPVTHPGGYKRHQIDMHRLRMMRRD